MRGVFYCLTLSFGFLASGLVPAQAQDGPPPSVTDPDRLPGVAPLPGEDDSLSPPMVIPPPDEAPTDNPDAFGSAPPTEEETAPDEDTRTADETPVQEIDRLFTELRRVADARDARRVAGRIERHWRRSGSATIDLLMQRAARAMTREDNAAALDVLDQALVIAPDYPEAWNRRATLNFSMNRLGKSLADIEQTLVREPRHWGALMGLAIILEQTGHKDKALETYLRVLAVYPALDSAQDAAGRLSEELLGPAI
ncbi:tetratricopeptide repeat protein [Aurantimonas sp. A2-1-M11]|uniref:tetratricopeptide repeat protein n=1 Tax=Aurantimonas sp. A2-1-M11 TaxID=3113712 RepID=UPI002F940B29